MNSTILLTTHDMIEAETLCERVAFMDSGQVMALDAPEALKWSTPTNNGHKTPLRMFFWS